MEPVEAAYLRGGYWAAAQAALAMLAASGRLVAGSPGRVQRAGFAPPADQVLARALFSELYGMAGPRELANKPRVQEVLRGIRLRLVRRGYLRPWPRRVLLPAALVAMPSCVVAPVLAGHGANGLFPVLVVVVSVALASWFLPRKTLAGERALRTLRLRHADLAVLDRRAAAVGGDADPQTIELAVALFGNAALRALLPRLAVEGGLLDGGKWTPRLDEPEPKGRGWR